jgi:hypothetical protein
MDESWKHVAIIETSRPESDGICRMFPFRPASLGRTLILIRGFGEKTMAKHTLWWYSTAASCGGEAHARSSHRG